jgi:hypothetical protein
VEVGAAEEAEAEEAVAQTSVAEAEVADAWEPVVVDRMAWAVVDLTRWPAVDPMEWAAVVDRMPCAGMDHMAWVMDRICVAVILPKAAAEESSGAVTVTLPTIRVETAGVLPKETATSITITATAIVCSAMGPGCGSTGRITTLAMIVIGCLDGHASLVVHTGGANTTPASVILTQFSWLRQKLRQHGKPWRDRIRQGFMLDFAACQVHSRKLHK